MTTATVRLWGTDIGYVSMNKGEVHGRFEYDPEFVAAGIELAPLVMPVESRRIYRFPELKPRSFHCLLYTSPSPRDQRGSRMPSSA